MTRTYHRFEILQEGRLFKWALITSLAGHLLLIGTAILSPHWRSEPDYLSSFIDVRMVDLNEIPEAGGAKAKSEEAEISTKKPEPKTKAEVNEEESAKATKKETAKAEISIAKKEPKAKVAMKYKTFKTKRVIRKALEKIEKRVDAAPPRPLAETIKRLRDKVEKEEEGKGGSGVDVPSDAKGARTGVFSRGSKQKNELIDLYRLEVAYDINKNWALSEQLTGTAGKLETKIVFKVLPDGTITDIFYTDYSGNSYLDESAYKAIVKSNPVRPHPEGLNAPFVIVAIAFGPEGVK